MFFGTESAKSPALRGGVCEMSRHVDIAIEWTEMYGDRSKVAEAEKQLAQAAQTLADTGAKSIVVTITDEADATK